MCIWRPRSNAGSRQYFFAGGGLATFKKVNVSFAWVLLLTAGCFCVVAPWGKRSWKTFDGVLKGMVLYLQKVSNSIPAESIIQNIASFPVFCDCAFLYVPSYVLEWLSKGSAHYRGGGERASLSGWTSSRLHQEATRLPFADGRLEGFSLSGLVSRSTSKPSIHMWVCAKESNGRCQNSHLFFLSGPKRRWVRGSAAST